MGIIDKNSSFDNYLDFSYIVIARGKTLPDEIAIKCSGKDDIKIISDKNHSVIVIF
jgi:hypothetical protein